MAKIKIKKAQFNNVFEARENKLISPEEAEKQGFAILKEDTEYNDFIEPKNVGKEYKMAVKNQNITEAQIIPLFNNKNTDNFYEEGNFTISNEKMEKNRNVFYPSYEKLYENDKNKIIHHIAFVQTMHKVDAGEKIPEFGDYKLYHSLGNIPFSKKQIEYVENQIKPTFENMSVKELYDYLIISQEKSMYENDIDAKKAIEELINNKFFDKYLNGYLKPLALWSLGKLDDINEMVSWLYSKNKFTKKLNFYTVNDEIDKTMDEISNNDDGFMKNKIFIALDKIKTSMRKLNKIPK